MVKLNPRRIDNKNHNTPVLYDWEIDNYAHAVLKDYKPHLLESPGAINFRHFLESYLGASIEYHDIYNDDPKHPILAMTVYGQGDIKIFDRENKRICRIDVPKRTVVIDNSVMEFGREGLALFSSLHEAGHITMHWDVYSAMLEESIETGDSIIPIVFCRRENIEKRITITGNKIKLQRTAEEWREHQADYFAAALAMPNATFKPFIHSLMRENGCFKGSITIGRDNDLDILTNDIMPEAISEVYGVSKEERRAY